MNLIEQVQYKAALIVSGCWQGTRREKLYNDLGWESLSERRWSRRIITFYKILNGMAPSCLLDHLPEITAPFCINNWNNIDDTIKSLPSLNEFKNKLCKFIRPEKSSFYNIRDSYGIKLLTKIRVSFSDLRDHRYDHKFNCDNPTCLCGLEDETAVPFFLCCPRFDQLRIAYLGKVSEIVGSDVTVLPNDHLTHILMYGSNIYNGVSNEAIIIETIQFIKKSERFKKLEAFDQ